MQKVGAAVYGQAGADAPPPPEGDQAGTGESGTGDEGTVEGEFREV